GLQAAVTPAMSGILSPLFGRLADRFGRKMMLIRSLVGFVVIVAAMGLVTSVEQLFIARLVMGLFAGFTPMVMALATTSAPREPAPRVPLQGIFQYPHFATVMALLFTAQFLDRGLGLLIPLQVAHMPGIEKIAATAGAIVSIGAIAATTSANVAARLSREIA